MRRTRVYIASPYSKGDRPTNAQKSQEVWQKLWKAGYNPFCPLWSHYQNILFPGIEYEEWMEFDLDWLSSCDVLLRLPGESSGADREVEAAVRQRIWIYTSFDELVQKVPSRWLDYPPFKKMSVDEQIEFQRVDEQIEYQSRLGG